ncbi:hypothetical protein RND81_13G071200 [Saponaria officinalis]|uniref:Uncharacterized protein n=1 Tax=Saponaria officinalis TaxID=3572 RepID=A0AAW1GZL3_SAPOF
MNKPPPVLSPTQHSLAFTHIVTPSLATSIDALTFTPSVNCEFFRRLAICHKVLPEGDKSLENFSFFFYRSLLFIYLFVFSWICLCSTGTRGHNQQKAAAVGRDARTSGYSAARRGGDGQGNSQLSSWYPRTPFRVITGIVRVCLCYTEISSFP